VSNEKMKLTHVTAELIVEIRCGDKSLDKSRNQKVSINTGSSACVVLNEFTKGIPHKQSEDPQQWMTKGGLFQTRGVCRVKFYLPEFSTQECVKWKSHVDNSKHVSKSCCDMILGRNLSEQLPPNVKFSDRTATWQEVTVPVKSVDESDNQNVNEIVEQCCETGHLGEVTRRTMEILDASHQKANSHTMASKCTCLSKEERSALLKSLLRPT
jgi:hypothetical protein